MKKQLNYKIISSQWDYLTWEKEQHGITEIIPLLGIINFQGSQIVLKILKILLRILGSFLKIPKIYLWGFFRCLKILIKLNSSFFKFVFQTIQVTRYDFKNRALVFSSWFFKHFFKFFQVLGSSHLTAAF